LADLRQGIRDMAGKHGFDLCRYTCPEVPATHTSAFEQWVQAGMYGDMAWMAEETRMRRRMHPETMLEGVRSVITVGMRHSPPAYTLAESEKAKDRGAIAAFAHGDDYHDVMKKRLKVFARDLDTLLGKHGQRVYVDTAPVLEHALAESSGLGWQGKHSLTINKDLGSWFMLGEIFTTAELMPDKPASNHCGTCIACMSICPTGAIVAPYIVDARSCISYLTIEYKGFIPLELRPLLGNRIFGCDDCQQICPWNSHAHAPEADLLHPRDDNALPELSGLFALDEDGFRMRFRKSPLKRTGRTGLLRNIAIAMGNSGDSGYAKELTGALADPEPLIRGHAAWALARLGITSALAVLYTGLEQERHEEAKQEIALSIHILEKRGDK